ncbi:MAG: hypothetical protein OWT28_11665 [Firmicutes bacterium]|nr:hypothetical protein [Bacillota bacterium]
MAKRDKPTHLQLLNGSAGSRKKRDPDHGALPEAIINSMCERILADAQTHRRLSSKIHSFPPASEDETEDIWMFVAEDTTPIKTSGGDLTLHEFLEGIRGGAEIHVHRDEIIPGLLILVAEQIAFSVDPSPGIWWVVSGLV